MYFDRSISALFVCGNLFCYLDFQSFAKVRPPISNIIDEKQSVAFKNGQHVVQELCIVFENSHVMYPCKLIYEVKLTRSTHG